MHVVRAGELFAEASLFSERYHCDAVAVTDSELRVYSRRPLETALRADAAALWAFAADLARKVQGLRTRLELKQTRSATLRVLQFLRLRCGQHGTLRVPETLKQLAAEIGLTHEAFYRALATLERDGQIVRSPGVIRLRPSGPGGAARPRVRHLPR